MKIEELTKMDLKLKGFVVEKIPKELKKHLKKGDFICYIQLFPCGYDSCLIRLEDKTIITTISTFEKLKLKKIYKLKRKINMKICPITSGLISKPICGDDLK